MISAIVGKELEEEPVELLSTPREQEALITHRWFLEAFHRKPVMQFGPILEKRPKRILVR